MISMIFVVLYDILHYCNLPYERSETESSRFVGRLLLTSENNMPHVKILEHISSSNISKFLVKIWSGLKE